MAKSKKITALDRALSAHNSAMAGVARGPALDMKGWGGYMRALRGGGTPDRAQLLRDLIALLTTRRLQLRLNFDAEE